MRFILPPHPAPQMRIRRQDLPLYESQNKWIAQRKFNGTHVVICIAGGEIGLWDRRGNPLTLYKLTAGMKNCLLSLYKGTEIVVCGELLHTKAKSKITGKQCATDTIVLFDVIYQGDHLTQLTQIERLNLLSDLCGNPITKEPGTFPGSTSRALIVKEEGSAHLWMAEIFFEEFDYHFDSCFDTDTKGKDMYPEIEGLILRLRDSKLRVGGSGDVDWLVRVRKPKPHMYTF
jgi:hypothetical protein